MLSLAVLPAAYGLYWIFAAYASLQKHISDAEASGLPYVVMPINLINRFWIITFRVWLPLITRLPARWTHPWVK
jgi:hypothetical protein